MKIKVYGYPLKLSACATVFRSRVQPFAAFNLYATYQNNFNSYLIVISKTNKKILKTLNIMWIELIYIFISLSLYRTCKTGVVLDSTVARTKTAYFFLILYYPKSLNTSCDMIMLTLIQLVVHVLIILTWAFCINFLR